MYLLSISATDKAIKIRKMPNNGGIVDATLSVRYLKYVGVISLGNEK